MEPEKLITIDISLFYNKQKINCSYCKSFDHTGDSCPKLNDRKKNVKCYTCSEYGHRSYNCEKGKNVYAFNGINNKLSNFYKCDINVDDNEYISSEQLFQWKKAETHNEHYKAENILKAEKPFEAKKIGDSVVVSQSWETDKLKTMDEVIRLKLDQCTAFKTELLKTGKKTLAESTRDRFWGTGLSKEETIKTVPSEWPGKNKMGLLLEALRQELTDVFYDSLSDEVTKTKDSSENNSNIAEGYMITHQLLDKALKPSDGTSPEVLQRAMTFIDQQTPTSESNKRKDISPLSTEKPAKSRLLEQGK